jgi:hypothetical protein
VLLICGNLPCVWWGGKERSGRKWVKGEAFFLCLVRSKGWGERLSMGPTIFQLFYWVVWEEECVNLIFKLFLCPYNELVTYYMVVNFFFAAAFFFFFFSLPHVKLHNRSTILSFFSIHFFFPASKHIKGITPSFSSPFLFPLPISFPFPSPSSDQTLWAFISLRNDFCFVLFWGEMLAAHGGGGCFSLIKYEYE